MGYGRDGDRGTGGAGSRRRFRPPTAGGGPLSAAPSTATQNSTEASVASSVKPTFR